MTVNKEEVLASAKKIMDDFMVELDKCEVTEEEFGQFRDDNKRDSKEMNDVDREFIKGVFNNAPSKRDEFIIIRE